MIFAQPWWLLAGALASLTVVLLHTYRRRRHVVPSLALWRHLRAESTPRTSLSIPRPSWPLFLQVLTVLLISLALAGPTFRSDPSHNLVFLDASASMGAPSRDGTPNFARAVATIQSKVVAEGTWSALVVGDEVQPVALGIPDGRDLVDKLRSEWPAPGAGRADWQGASELAANLLNEEGEARAWVLTDEVPVAREALADSDFDIEVHALDAPEANVGIRTLTVQESPESQTGPGAPRSTGTDVDESHVSWSVSAALAVQGDVEGRGIVRFAFQPRGTDGFIEWAEEELLLERGASAEVDLSVPGPGILRAELSSLEDASLPGWPADDTHVVRLTPEAERTPVLVVGDPSQPMRRALEASDDVDVEIRPRAEQISDVEDTDVIIALEPLSNEPPLPTWYAGVPLPQVQGDIVTERVTSWDPLDPLAEGVPWATLPEFSSTETGRVEGARVPVWGGGGPLVQAWANARSRHLVTSFTPEALADASSSALPSFVSSALAWLAPRGPTAQTCRVGVVCRLDWDAVVTDPAGWEVRTEIRRQRQPYALAWKPRRPGLHEVRHDHVTQLLPVLPQSVTDTIPEASGNESSTAQGERDGVGWEAVELLWLLALLPMIADGLLIMIPWMRRRPRPRWRLRGVGSAFLALVSVVGLLAAALALPWPQRLHDRYVVVVGDNPDSAVASAALERSGGTRKARYVPMSASGPGDATHLPLALELGDASIPHHAAGHIVVDEPEAIPNGFAFATSRGIASSRRIISWAPTRQPERPAVAIERLLPPSQVRAGAPSTLYAHVSARVSGPADLRLYRNGEVVIDRSTEFQEGRNLVTLPIDDLEPGPVSYHLQLDSDAEGRTWTTSHQTIVNVLPPVRAAVVAQSAHDAEAFVDVLETQQITAQPLEPASLPHDSKGWHGWDGVVLLDLPAIALHSRQQEAIEAFVRERGGGLALLGGPSSFGPGGYFRTPLDRVSPLSSRVEREAPEVAMVFVLDRSGSMQQRVGDATRLDVAKQATISAMELLNEASQVSVVMFDEQAQILAPLQSVQNLRSIEQAFRGVTPGGGTAIAPGLRLGLEQARTADSSARHIVVMSDGLSQPGSFQELLSTVAREQISVSTVAIGRGADVTQLERIAEWGGGTSHATDDFRALPAILSQEAMLFSRSPVHDTSTSPRWEEQQVAFLQGWPNELPAIQGHVETTEKPQSNVHLRAGSEGPLLASWRYGLGHAISFTSDAVGPWTEAWQDHPSYARWWAQAIRWTARSSASTQSNLDVRSDRFELIARMSPHDSDGPVAGEALTLTIDGNDYERTISLHETGPGTYEGRYLVPSGRYDVQAELPEGMDWNATGSVRVSSEPARTLNLDPAYHQHQWSALANAAGGSQVTPESLTFPDAAPGQWRWTPMSRPWGASALLAFVMLLVLRYSPRLPGPTNAVAQAIRARRARRESSRATSSERP